jgi:hypothetical protein
MAFKGSEHLLTLANYFLAGSKMPLAWVAELPKHLGK